MNEALPRTPDVGARHAGGVASPASPLRLGPPRCVAHVDLDCFYCQVETRQRPELRGKPVAVVQYNPWESGGVTSRGPEDDRVDNASNGSLIAVSYEARAHGVKRNMRGGEARAACPELVLVQVPTAHGKSDMQLYRDAGAEVAAVLGRFASALEKASVDEAYMDVTQAAARLLATRDFQEVLDEARGTHVAGGDCPGIGAGAAVQSSRREVRAGAGSGAAEPEPEQPGRAAWLSRPEAEWDARERLLAAGCAVVARARAEVRDRTGFTCSAGVADNKLMAKLCSGLHKPNQQTALPRSAVPRLMEALPLDRIRGLGGKLGAQVAVELGGGRERGASAPSPPTVGVLARCSAARLRGAFGDKTGQWLHRMAHGLDDEPVKDRRASDSVSNGKRYDSGQTLMSVDHAAAALRELAGEISGRLAAERSERHREPRTLSLSVLAEGERNATGAASRSCTCRPGLAGSALGDEAVRLLRAWAAARMNAARNGLRIHGLFLTASNFQPVHGHGCQSLAQFLVTASPSKAAASPASLAAAEIIQGQEATPSGPAAASGPPHRSLAHQPAKPLPRSTAGACPWSPLAGTRLGSCHGAGSAPPAAASMPPKLRRDDIDESVLRELPDDIRREVLMAAQAGGPGTSHTRSCKAKKRSRGSGGASTTSSRSIRSFFGRAEPHASHK